ncbi:MAG: hypothetical protein SNF33_03670 [Candidatus Algichlamydia australiensis]|nr:hypothetical protein [Chlamydiales bacterium]
MEISVAKKIWNGLFLVLLVCALWIGIQLGRELKKYFVLKAKTKVELKNWETREVEPDLFVPSVNYEFEVGKQNFEGQYTFEKTLFPNEASCRVKVEKFEKLPWEIHFSPKDPNISSLQKDFPFKKSVHMLLALSVLVYFVWFRSYLNQTYS